MMPVLRRIEKVKHAHRPAKINATTRIVNTHLPTLEERPHITSNKQGLVEKTGEITVMNETRALESAPRAKAQHIEYPDDERERVRYRTPEGKKLTAHQWAVYDYACTIPMGKVTTYKNVSLAAGGSPRSVGSALRNNPFSPVVPCHRVIASNLFVGGFFGEWGQNGKTGTRVNQKLSMLEEEGVDFTPQGYLAQPAMLL